MTGKASHEKSHLFQFLHLHHHHSPMAGPSYPLHPCSKLGDIVGSINRKYNHNHRLYYLIESYGPYYLTYLDFSLYVNKGRNIFIYNMKPGSQTKLDFLY